MTPEEECLECKWCNHNRLSWFYIFRHKINPFARLYVDCMHPQVYWIREGKRVYLPCVSARVETPDTETVTRCGNKKYFQPK